MRRIFALLLVALPAVHGSVLPRPVHGEVPQLSLKELTSESSQIIVGKVRAVYSTSEKSNDWQNTHSIAEIEVGHVEKGIGTTTGDIVYAHFWNKNWIGTGTPEPHSQGHIGVSKGETVRAYLNRKDGIDHVLLPNGFSSLKPDDIENASAPTEDKELAAVQGKWMRTVRTGKGTYKIVKEHTGHQTKLTITNAYGIVVEAKNSEFRLRTTDSVRVFTFFNNVATIGPNKGRTDKTPQSYVYRVTDDTFFEVRGLLLGDDDRLSAFTWKRVKD